jgi:poly-gamma-glutamate capsule biosynthesis protein CapA/YwtB (metallophosphatase superfamily)
VRRGPFAVVVLVLLGGLAAAVALRSTHRDSQPQPRAATTSEAPSPTARPSPSARSSPSPTHRGPLLLHGTGDVSLDPSYIPNLRTYGYDYAFSGMNGLFKRDDLTVINLECPASHAGTIIPKEFNFRCDPAALPAAKAAGVDVANQGNNHAYDYGPEALLDSRHNIQGAGIAPVGSGKDPDQAEEPAFFDVKGWRIAVVGIDEVLDPEPDEAAAPGHPGTACGHDVGCMVESIRRAEARADLVVVIIHWGVELDTQPESYQVEQARQFIDAGADVIFGGHSHRLQPLAFYKGKPIFYSLGNFVWPAFSVEGSTTGVAEVRVRPDGKISAKLLPAYIGSSGHPQLTGA